MAGDVRDGRNAEVRRYGKEVVGVHWLFQVFVYPLVFTGWFMLRDWFLETFNIYHAFKVFPTYGWTPDVHTLVGVCLVFVGLIHLFVHSYQKDKPMVPRDTGRDLKASMHNIMFLFFMARRPTRGADGKYRGDQRMTYVATTYTLLLSAVTAVFVMTGLLGETGLILHIISAVLFLFLSAYRILTLIRGSDMVITRSILATGTVPRWYAKKHFFGWYRRTEGGYRPPPEIDFDRLMELEEASEEVEG